MYQINNNTYAIEEGEEIKFVRDGGGKLVVKYQDKYQTIILSVPSVEKQKAWREAMDFTLKIIEIQGEERTGMSVGLVQEFVNTAQLDMEDKHRS